MRRISLTRRGSEYWWDPCKSTPSAREPLAELAGIVGAFKRRGATCVVDFGAGRGRNAGFLSRHFARVYLVEHKTNVPQLQRLARSSDLRNCKVLAWEQYARRNLPRVLGILVCCVLHTVPSVRLRRALLRVNVRKVAHGGLLAVATPKDDPKYSKSALKGVLRFHDGEARGIVRLYEHDRTFSFYRKLSMPQLVSLLASAGLSVVRTVPSPHRLVLLAAPAEAGEAPATEYEGHELPRRRVLGGPNRGAS